MSKYINISDLVDLELYIPDLMDRISVDDIIEQIVELWNKDTEFKFIDSLSKEQRDSLVEAINNYDDIDD